MINGEWRLTGEGITGWARDTEKERPLWLELWGDGELMGVALADLPEPRDCGFWLPLGAALRETAQEIEVRVANSEEKLPRSEEAEAPEPEQGLVGVLQVDRGLIISGWVVDSARSEEQILLDAFIDGKKATECVAGERRYRPAQADGHGFSMQLPESYADGRTYQVEIRDRKGRIMPGSPFRICSMPKNMGVWLKEQKKLDRPLQEMAAGLLEKLEERLPGLLAESAYSFWKKAFPVSLPAGRAKAAIGVFGKNAAGLLKGQQGVDLREGKDYILFPGGAGKLHANAIANMLAAVKASDAAMVYADGESEAGEPLFKSAFDREAFLAEDYLGPILAKRELVEEAGIIAGENEAAARLKLAMAAGKRGGIAHAPQILSVSGSGFDSGRDELVASWLAANYPGASFANGRARYALNEKPRVSIIIPTRDHGDLLKVCLESIGKTDWPDYEVLIIDNGTVEEDALQVLAEAQNHANICVLRRPGVFNYAALNNEAARAASGKLICFLNNDTEVINADWLAEMASLLLMTGSSGGAVGAKLLWPNGLVQHGGVIVGTHQLAAHVGNLWLDDEPGYMNRNQTVRQYSAVTAACLLTPKELFLETGGFDARRFPIAFNDVDYCLRLGELGKKIYWTPYARLLHHESASRGPDAAGSARARAEREGKFFRMRWGQYDDIFYNPNLPLSAAAEPFHGLAFPPRPRELRVVKF